MKTGIYKITNTVNNKSYIGSSVNIKKRFARHLSYLKNDRHENRYLMRAWEKYGEKVFIFEVLLFCEKKNLAFFENRAIKQYGALNSKNGYNCVPAKRKCSGGSNSRKMYKRIAEANRGRKHSREAKKKISEAGRGRKHTEKTKEKLSIINSNRSQKTRQRISKALKGNKLSEECKRKISQTNKGRILSEETRARMSEARKGVKRSKEFCLKMSEINKGRIPSKKTREIWSRQRKGEMAGAKSPRAKATIVNGKPYPTVTAAIRALGISKATYYRKLRGGR